LAALRLITISNFTGKRTVRSLGQIIDTLESRARALQIELIPVNANGRVHNRSASSMCFSKSE
jgi:hypothetical protein